jgi:AcrR family transcriptional regulator
VTAPRQLLDRAARREAIVRGAAAAFAEKGYAGTSMEDVAAAAGITKLIVYRHFSSKEELYDAVLEGGS